MSTTHTVIETKSKELLDTLEKVTHFEPREPGKKLYDLGLLIRQPGVALSPEEVASLLPKGNAITYKLDNPYDVDLFLSALVRANREGLWLIVDCREDPHPTLIGVLKSLSESNDFTLSHFEDQEFIRMTLNVRTRVVFLIDSNILEMRTTHPYFLNLFGPVQRL